jgi:hypothetical protein
MTIDGGGGILVNDRYKLKTTTPGSGLLPSLTGFASIQHLPSSVLWCFQLIPLLGEE